MPELPEVETVVRTLEKQIKDEEILDMIIRYPKTINGDLEDFRHALIHQSFRRFERRGKYLLFYMDDVLLVCHLRMEGKFYIKTDSEPVEKHTHVIFQLKDHFQLRYHDTRKFGRMEILPMDTDLEHFHDLGPEPFDDRYNAEYLKEYCRGRKAPIKSVLLEQSLVAGIGNIYADEILSASGIRPGRSCARLTRKNREDIVENTRIILAAAIAAGGTTIRSYTSSLGVTGRFQNECLVHGQKTCARCGSAIKVKWIGGRSSYYCPVCQKS